MKRLSLRVRLTIIYGGLFLVAGVVLLSTTYVLFSQQLTGSATRYLIRDARPVPSGTPSAAAPAPGRFTPDLGRICARLKLGGRTSESISWATPIRRPVKADAHAQKPAATTSADRCGWLAKTRTC